MKVIVAALQTKTFPETDIQARNVKKAREYVAEVYPWIYRGARSRDYDYQEADDRIRWLRQERDLYGPPLPWSTKPGTLRDWRRSEVYRKNCSDW